LVCRVFPAFLDDFVPVIKKSHLLPSMKLSFVLLLGLLASAFGQQAASTPVTSSLCPTANALCQELANAFENKQPITITETLLNPFSIVQFDGSGQNFFVGHPTGIEIETVFNPFALGTSPPDPNFPYTNAIGQDIGVCHSLASLPPLNATADVCGQDLCNLNFVFYSSSSVVAECMPPGSNCQSLSQQQVIGQISFQGLFGACANAPFNFEMPITGGTGIFRGAHGYITGLQIPSYAYFTYTIHFL
jgi:hypothetical protein